MALYLYQNSYNVSPEPYSLGDVGGAVVRLHLVAVVVVVVVADDNDANVDDVDGDTDNDWHYHHLSSMVRRCDLGLMTPTYHHHHVIRVCLLWCQ